MDGARQAAEASEERTDAGAEASGLDAGANSAPADGAASPMCAQLTEPQRARTESCGAAIAPTSAAAPPGASPPAVPPPLDWPGRASSQRQKRRFTVTRLEEVPGRPAADAQSGDQPPVEVTTPDADAWDYGEPPLASPPPIRPPPGPRQRPLATGNSATVQPALVGPLLAAQLATQPAGLQRTLLPFRLGATATMQPGLSGPLYRQLTSPHFNNAHTISYGHSDGRSLTVRRLLDWEMPDLHTVRKYASDSDIDSGSSRTVEPTRHCSRGRTTWTNKVEFVLACLGYTVGLGNLWRFPYLCYRSGGGAFFIPYLIMMFLCSVPLLLMEFTMGQFTRQGPVGAMGRLCPLFKGAGLAPVVISFLFCTYYNVVIAWALYYLFTSFSSEIPWRHCNNSWNRPSCEDTYGDNGTLSALATTPAEEYFNNRVLQISGGVDQVGSVRIPLLLSLLLAWVLVYFSIWKSIRSSGKVVYFTVIAPYLLLVAFLWRALTLDGASAGIRFLFDPQWELLADAKVWVNAAAQNFNSVGVGFGSMITFASYNKFQNRSILMDTIIICLVNLLTSVFAGIIVFAILGNIAMELNRPIDKVVVDGPGLVYVVYPKALASMPVPQVWAVLFFLMLLCLGLDSQFATLEVVITTMEDAFGGLVRRYLKRHEFLVLAICLVSFVLGLPHVTQGGMYFFQLMDYNLANISLMLLALFEVIAVAWIYGVERLSQDFMVMTGKRPSTFSRLCWKFLAPLLIFAIWVFSLIDHERLTYGSYRYPEWTSWLGWVLAALPVLPIPVCAVLALWQASGDTLLERLKASVQPDHRLHTALGFEPTVDGPDELAGPYLELQTINSHTPCLVGKYVDAHGV